MVIRGLQTGKHGPNWDFRPAELCLLMLLTCVLSSCAVGPDFVRPKPPEAKGYTANTESDLPPDVPVQKIVSGADIAANWWTLFQSAQLNSLVDEAIQHNATLEVSLATLRQSQHNLQAGYGVFFPQFDIGFGGARERNAPVQQGLKTSSSIFNVVTLSGSIGSGAFTLEF